LTLSYYADILAHMRDMKLSQSMSHILAPVSFEMPKRLWAIRENGEITEPPAPFQGAKWNTKATEREVRERLLAVRSKQDAAAFFDFAGYVVMLDLMNADGGVTATQPAYPLKPEKISDRLMAHLGEWQAACREILTKGYRYPSRPKKESPIGRGTVRNLARRGTGRYNGIPVTFTWDDSSKPTLTLRAMTTMEAAVLSCHVDKLAGWKFKQCQRRDCRAVYPVETGHKKMYCGYPCAHLEAVRRGRRKAKKVRRSTKGGKK
jgi:hypothetical protein